MLLKLHTYSTFKIGNWGVLNAVSENGCSCVTENTAFCPQRQRKECFSVHMSVVTFSPLAALQVLFLEVGYFCIPSGACLLDPEVVF